MPPLPNNTKISQSPKAPASLTSSSNPEADRSRRTLLLALAGCLVVAGLAAGVLLKRQQIHDWWRLRSYHPPIAIQRLAAEDSMVGYTKRMFYLNRPQLVSSVSSFRKSCPDNKDTIVLGCYHPGEMGIYLYDVQDPDLRGVTQVTAAHETLHAIYGRLSGKERNYVNGLLSDYYQHGLQNQRVKSEIELYKKTEPNDVVDEMHSTFGTEIANLPAPLETYYKQYFANRAIIVSYEQQYEQAFSSRQQVVMADDQQLAAMKSQINAQQAAVNSQQAQVQARKAQLDGLLAAGQNDAYNTAVNSYNNQVNAYNANVASLRSLIKAYNNLVATRNTIADQINALNQALDTRQAH